MIALLLGLLLGLGDLAGAERAYRAGSYAQALELYQSALAETEAPSAQLLYNLGNCAYRLGRHAEALLYYRRALLRSPRDRELRFNLRLTRQRLGVEPPGGDSFGAALEELLDFFTPGELLALVAALEGLGLAGLVLLRRRRAARIAMALLVALALAGAARLVRAQCVPRPPAGIVLAREIALRPAPRTDLAATAELRAGQEVRIEELAERWIRIRHARGSGWTERAGVGLVE